MKLWLKKKLLRWMKIPFDEVSSDTDKLTGQDRTIAIRQYIMSNKFPEEPGLKEAFIKHWFLLRGVVPREVDKLSLQLISDLVEIDTLKTQLADVKNIQKDNIERMKDNGTTNTSKARPGHKRTR